MLHASERDTPRVQALRRAWWRRVRVLDPGRLVFIDETGVTIAMTRLYGRAPRGRRVIGAVPCHYGQTLTLLGALGRRGLVAGMSVEGPTDAAVFLAFLAEVLGPQLQAGDVVVMDRLGAHRVPAVRPTVRAAGGRLLYLPPYSPDFNPMELCWSKVKEGLRAWQARTRRALDHAITAVLAQVTSQDARGWFRHCGYSVH